MPKCCAELTAIWRSSNGEKATAVHWNRVLPRIPASSRIGGSHADGHESTNFVNTWEHQKNKNSRKTARYIMVFEALVSTVCGTSVSASGVYAQHEMYVGAHPPRRPRCGMA